MSFPADARKTERIPLALEVQYLSQGSFLLSYSRNLSKGGLFLETNDLVKEGTKLTVRIKIPGIEEAVETQAQVMWIRQGQSADNLPNGLGLQFDKLEEHIGEIIDRLVRFFQGLKLTAVAGDQPTLERLGSYLHSILSCEVQTILANNFAAQAAESSERSDLLVVDLDSAGEEGFKVIKLARERSDDKLPQPVIALCRQPDLKAQALTAGAQDALDNPPSYDLLRQHVLELLEKPLLNF